MPPPPSPLTVLGDLVCDGSSVFGSTEGTGSTVRTDGDQASDVAYFMPLEEPSSITLSTCGSSLYFDTWLHLYTADGEMLGEEIASCDDCGGFQCYSNEYHSVLSSLDGSLPSTLPEGKRDQFCHRRMC